MSEKLKLRANDRLLVLNAPSDQNVTHPHSTNPADRKTFDVVVLYAVSQAELERFASVALGAIKADGLIWVAFPTLTSTRHRDLSPGEGWGIFSLRGFEAIDEVDLDADWCALSLRHRAFAAGPRRR